MAEYYALLTKAVGRLQPNTEGSRREIYVKARNALIQQLKAIQPPLSPSEISKQRLELEEAIRKVERDMAGGAPAAGAEISRSAARAMEEALAGTPEPPPPPPPPRPVAMAPRPQPVPPPVPVAVPVPEPAAAMEPEPAPAPVQAPAPRPVVSAPVRAAPEPVVAVPVARADGPREMPPARSLRDALRPAPAPVPPPSDEDAFGAAPAAQPSVTRTVVTRSPARPAGQPRPVPYRPANADFAEGQGTGGLSDAVAADLAEGGRLSRSERRRLRREAAAEAQAAKPRRRGIGGRLIVYLVIVVILAGAAYGVYRFWPDIRQWVASLGDGPVVETTGTTTTAGTTTAGTTTAGNDVRIVGPQPVDAGATLVNPVGVNANTGPTQAILYEEGVPGQNTPTLDATIAWRIVPDPAGPIIAATIEVPERHMTILFSIQENHNTAFAFSHEIDFLVTIDPNYTHPAGGVESIATLAVKTTEDAIGEPIVGRSQSLPPDFFWIELDQAAVNQNINRLRSRDWFDLGIVYANGERAILTFEKGLDGQQVFQEALTAWAAN